MIDIQNLSRDFGGTVILDGITLRLDLAEKTGLIGRNGAGKTTLVRILTGEDDDFSGRVNTTGGVRVAYVPQYFPEFDGTARDFLVEPVYALRARLAELEDRMGQCEGRELERVLDDYGSLRARYDSVSGDEAEERALRFLDGLGLGGCADTPTAVLSGGERNVLALGRAALERPDLLILDEPGNHLDIRGLAWLEGFIRDWPGAVLVISHNRYLLDRSVSRIVELEAGKVDSFTGNYSGWRMERLRRAVSGEMAYRADQKKIERLEALVKRFEQICRATADPAWGKRLRSRRTQLAKTKERAAEKPVDPDSSFEVRFDAEASRARLALKVAGLDCRIGTRVLLEDVELVIETGERVALVGPNGSGKTTFLRTLKALAADEREVRFGPSMKVAWCDQHGESLDRSATLLDVCVDAGALNFDAAWKALAPFLFDREDLYRTVGTLSGGELNRLQLALAVIAKANFLILDEPTNHLDIPACEAVEDALTEFAGTILVVSHDRYFLDRIATRVIEIDDGELVAWDGNFSEYWFRRWGRAVGSPFAGQTGQVSGGKSGAADITDRGRKLASAGAPKVSTNAAELERRIVELEAERETLERETGEAYSAGELKRARDLGNRLAALSRRIDDLYRQWA